MAAFFEQEKIMAKKLKLNLKTLKAFFDYHSFSPNKKLEQLVQESLERTEPNNQFADSPKAFPRTASETSIPMELGSLEMLSAAGVSNQANIPLDLRH